MTGVRCTGGRIAALLLTLLVGTGCASAASFAELREERDELVRLERRFAEETRLPTAEAMAPDVELVTFQLAAGSGGGVRRDTLRGGEQVAGWLQQLQAQQLPAVQFSLGSSQVYRCQEGVVQSGTYPLLPPGMGGPPVTQQYRALWSPAGTGNWQLDRIWLDPGTEARVQRIGTHCRSVEDVLRESRRAVVRFETLTSFSPAVNDAGDAIREAGWTYEDHPVTERGTIGFALGVGYRLTPMWSVQALAIQEPEMTARGRLTTQAQEPTLGIGRRMAGVLALADLGMLQIGGGPLFAQVDLEWTEGWNQLDPVSTSHTTAGGLLQASFLLPSFSHGRPYVGLRYVILGDAEVPAYSTAEGFSLSANGLDLSLGIELVF